MNILESETIPLRDVPKVFKSSEAVHVSCELKGNLRVYQVLAVGVGVAGAPVAIILAAGI